MNTYAYVGSNPLTVIDPSGLICIPDWVASTAGNTMGGLVLGGLSGAAEGRTPVTALIGAGIGLVGGLSTGLMSHFFGGGENGGSAAAAGYATISTAIQSHGNIGEAIANTALNGIGTKLGYRGVGSAMMARSAGYVSLGIAANTPLGAGKYVAGPVFGLAGAFTDMATEAAVKAAGDPCDYK